MKNVFFKILFGAVSGYEKIKMYSKLGVEWEIRESKEYPGRIFYYNNETGVSSWIRPCPFNCRSLKEGMQWLPLVYVSHILVKHVDSSDPLSPHKEVVRSKNDALEKAKNIIRKITVEKVPFSVLAENESDDINTFENKGIIGWIKRGQYPPSFENVAFSLGVGELSENPVETNEGWHIIKRDG